jgi:DNA repair ATPase RecN
MRDPSTVEGEPPVTDLSEIHRSISEIHRALSEIHRSLGRVEGKLNSLIARTDVHEETINSHAKRIGELEGSHRWFTGVWAGVGMVAGAAVSWGATLLGIGSHKP